MNPAKKKGKFCVFLCVSEAGTKLSLAGSPAAGLDCERAVSNLVVGHIHSEGK